MMQGVIGRHFEKSWQGKTFWSFALNGQDGIVGTGMRRPPSVGTSVKFNEKKNAKGYLEVDGSIQIVQDGEAAAVGNITTVAKAASAGAGGGVAYWDRKEARDLANDAARELGASRNTAIALIDLALKYEVFKLPAAAKREEFLFGVLDKYAAKLMGKDTPVVSDEVKEEAESNDPQNDKWS